jgi:hypothetical protein
VGWDAKSSRGDLGGVKTEIFFGKSEIRLGTPVNKPPDGQITGPRREHIALVSRTQLEGLMDECRVLDDVGGPSVTLKKDRNAATV